MWQFDQCFCNGVITLVIKNEIAITLALCVVNTLLIAPIGYIIINTLDDYDEFKIYVIRQLEEADDERKQLSSRITTETAKNDANAATLAILTKLLTEGEVRQKENFWGDWIMLFRLKYHGHKRRIFLG